MTFSIIIPVYNVEPYLRECLDSVVAQTFPDWEAICVDDGSNDGSGLILDEYEGNDSRFHVFHQRNAGVSDARNTALKNATGEYFVFLDSDDAIGCDYLRQLAESIISACRPCVLRHHGLINVSNLGKLSVQILSTDDSARTPLGRFISDVLINSSLCLFVWRRDVVESIEFPKGVRYGEDDVYFIRAIPKIESYEQTDIIQYKYRNERVGAASRTLTCLDMSRVLKLAKDELVSDRYRNKVSAYVIHDFYLLFFRKEIMRVRGRDARNGSRELYQCLRECRDVLGSFEAEWSWIDRLWLHYYLGTGSWLVSDAVRVALYVIRFPQRVASFCLRRARKLLRSPR